MSLAALNWRYVGSQNFAAATVAAMLDALYTLGTSATYADGTARTEGSGSAWTFTGNRYQNVGVTEAVYPSPPTNTLTQKVIFAGQATGGVKTPTMASPDTSATVTVMVGINKNSGAFNAWDNASPMTSGSFSGYWRMWPGSAGASTVYLWESQEGILVVVGSGTSLYAAVAGAFVDPESPDTTSDAESDGKLYGMSVSNVNAVMNGAWWSAGGTTDFLRNINAASQAHAMVFTPGAGTLISCELLARPNTAMTTTGCKTRSGRWARYGIAWRSTAAAPNDNFIGRLREMYLYSDGQTPQKQTNAGSTIGFLVSAGVTATADTLFLAY